MERRATGIDDRQTLEGHPVSLTGLEDETAITAAVDDWGMPRRSANGSALTAIARHVPEVHRLLVDAIADPDGVTGRQNALGFVDGLKWCFLGPVSTASSALVDGPLGGLQWRSRQRADGDDRIANSHEHSPFRPVGTEYHRRRRQWALGPGDGRAYSRKASQVLRAVRYKDSDPSSRSLNEASSIPREASLGSIWLPKRARASVTVPGNPPPARRPSR